MRRFRRIVVVLGVLALLAWWFLPRMGPRIAPDSALVLELNGEYVEAAEPPLLARLLGDGRHAFVALLSELRKAERDERLAVVVLRVRDLAIGWAKAQELRAALAGLRAHGRRVIAYLETTELGANVDTTSRWHRRCARRRRFADRAGGNRLRAAFGKFGVDVEVGGSANTRSAAETLSRQDVGPTARWRIRCSTRSGRSSWPGSPRAAPGARTVRRGSTGAEPPEQLKVGLIDGISSGTSWRRAGRKRQASGGDYARVDPSWSASRRPRASLIYGNGNVVVGDGTVSRSGSRLRLRHHQQGAADVGPPEIRPSSSGSQPRRLAAAADRSGARRARRALAAVIVCSDLAASPPTTPPGADAIVAQRG
jgi:hypothetical protein